MRPFREVMRLKYEAGLGHRAIARACSVGVGTVSEYVRRAARAGLGWPLLGDLDDAALEARLYPAPAGPGSVVRAMPDCAKLHQELRRAGVTLQLLWLEYREVHPEGYQYSQFCERYRRFAKKLSPSMRQVHRAGEKAFVDFSGKKPALADRRTGEIIPAELFVGVLGASGFIYAEATRSQDLLSWIAAHVRMVEWFGGAPEIFVPDNLRSAVTSSCRYEPTVNRTYADFAEHYNAVVVPARVYRPKDKDQSAYCTSSLLCGAS
jgi:transposase